ncbi:hypothetical protein CDAR_121501 [Caerostris darwini]|uniref:Tc1-like transposase DDE domain-containing protein n=1 Tax=Caerostris darwini TaxID=1538125 RepID=A0AAV4M840_9ARAC|nr:hypothetical protein CDAR_121501 [Caerostris darwini]
MDTTLKYRQRFVKRSILIYTEAFAYQRPLEKYDKLPFAQIIPHDDDAISHKLVRTIHYLTAQNIELMINPSYSPNLAPINFFLFPYLKNKLRDH